jgi:hypothetical protein
MLAKRKLFRTQALKHYTQNKQKDILPTFVAPPIFLLFWLLLLIIGVALFFSWQERVPTYTQALGIVLEQPNQPATALLFLPPASATNLAVGQQLTFQVNITGQKFQSDVTSISSDPITPENAIAQYGLTGDTQSVIDQPSLVVAINLTPQQTQQVVDHLSIVAQIRVGSSSLLSMLPGLLSNAFGG